MTVPPATVAMDYLVVEASVYKIKYFLIRDLSKKYETDFDIVHIICDKLNINETNINKGTLNEIVSEIKKYNDKKRKTELDLSD